METLVLAAGYAEAAHVAARTSEAAEFRRVDPQHISQPLSAVLQRYGLSEREQTTAGEMPDLEIVAAGCDACLVRL